MRAQLGQRFANDDPEQVAAVISDLVSSGLVYTSGRGGSAIFRALSPDERRAVAQGDELEAITGLVWFETYRRDSASVEELTAELTIDRSAVERALATLLTEQRVTLRPGHGEPRYEASSFFIPLGAEHGWEAAVCDHFTAVATAIGIKLGKGARTTANENVGGATYAFNIHDAHPARERVLALLREERERVSALWEEACQYNVAHPVDESMMTSVTFYFGQSVIDAERAIEGAT
jgi:predicted transcriptional regulator